MFKAGSTVCQTDCVISFFEFPKHRILNTKEVLRNPAQLKDPSQAGEVFDQLNLSIYLETPQAVKGEISSPDVNLESFNRKLPVASDIWHEHLVDMRA